MNLNDSEFERHLRDLRPTAPPAELAGAITRDLTPPKAALAVRVPRAAVVHRSALHPRALPGLLRGLGWAFAGACAALAAIAVVERAERPEPVSAVATPVEATEPFDHAESSAELVAAQDEGLVYVSDEVPARQVRYNSIERHVWTNASTGARLEIEVPREDIRLMPVAMQ